jgi:hypothetical protein
MVSDGVRRRRIVSLCGKRFFQDDLDFSERGRYLRTDLQPLQLQSPRLNEIYEYTHKSR